eukprot:2477512-Prymnesium_polylepis.1
MLAIRACLTLEQDGRQQGEEELDEGVVLVSRHLHGRLEAIASARIAGDALRVEQLFPGLLAAPTTEPCNAVVREGHIGALLRLHVGRRNVRARLSKTRRRFARLVVHLQF